MLRKIVFKVGLMLKKFGFHFDEIKSSAVLEMHKSMKGLGSIQFNIEFYPDGGWTAESTNIDGIITGGHNVKNINENIKDAIFTYFRVPAYLADDNLIKMDNEPAIVERRVYAVR